MLRHSPEDIFKHIERNKLPSDFNLLGLAEAASQQTFAEKNQKQAFLWASVAVKAFSKTSETLSPLILKAHLIQRFGCGENPIVNLETILADFKNELPYPLAELEALCATRKSLLNIQKLRNLKNRIHVIEPLLEKFPEFFDETLRKLVQIKPLLP